MMLTDTAPCRVCAESDRTDSSDPLGDPSVRPSRSDLSPTRYDLRSRSVKALHDLRILHRDLKCQSAQWGVNSAERNA